MSMTLEAPVWTFGELLWKARKDADLEQSEVAKVLGVSRALVSRWEHDLSDPGRRQLARFIELTGADWLRSYIESGIRWSCYMAQDVRDGYGDHHPLLPPRLAS
jgi:transcriptional regulator with XRE-family HTH domain